MLEGSGRSYTSVSFLSPGKYSLILVSYPTRSLLLCTWGQDGAGAFEPNTGKFVHMVPETADDFQVIE